MTTTTTGPSGRRVRKVLRAVPSWAYVIVCALVVLPPVAWVLSTSLKTADDTIQFPPKWIPEPFSFEEYAGLFNSTNTRFFVNSLVYACGTILLALAICVPAAYVATRA